jgi:ribose-phosphate pyrophosphokinase
MILINDKPLNVTNFPAGEHCFVGDNELDFNIIPDKGYCIEWKYENESELVTLQLIAMHIKERGGNLHQLYMPYLPHARMDRVKDEREVFTLKHFCKIINSLGFFKIYVNNPHSDVGVALLNNVKDRYIEKGKRFNNNDIINHLIKKLKMKPDADVIFYPDAGCAKKYKDVDFGLIPLVGNKVRNWKTREITKFDIEGDKPQNPCNILLVDDIIGKGSTIFSSIEKLKQELSLKKIYVYATHVENTILTGKLPDCNLIEKIYTTNSIFTKEHPLIEKVNLIP